MDVLLYFTAVVISVAALLGAIVVIRGLTYARKSGRAAYRRFLKVTREMSLAIGSQPWVEPGLMVDDPEIIRSDVAHGMFRGHEVQLMRVIGTGDDASTSFIRSGGEWWAAVVRVPANFEPVDIRRAGLVVGRAGTESETFNREFRVEPSDTRFVRMLVDGRMMRWLLDRPHDGTRFLVRGDCLAAIAGGGAGRGRVYALLGAAASFAEHVPQVAIATHAGAPPTRSDDGVPGR